MRKLWFVMQLAASFIFCSFQPAHAFVGTTFYVSTTGSDSSGNGSASAPWKTLAYAVTKVPANAGNGIFLAAGIYKEASSINIPTGVGIQGAGTTETILKYSGPSAGIFLNLNSTSHVNGNQTISNLTLDGNNKLASQGIKVLGRDNVCLSGLQVQYFLDVGISAIAQDVAGKPAYYISGLRITGCTMINSARDNSGWSSGAITLGGLSGGEIDHNTISENIGYGIKFGHSFGGFSGTLIHDNNITVNPVDATWGADCGIELWNAYDSTQVYSNNLNTWMSLVNHDHDSAGVTSLVVHDNSIIFPNANSLMAGIELAVSDAQVYNNYIQDQRWGLAMWQENSHDNLIYRNVFYNSTTSTQLYVAGIYLLPSKGNMVGHKIYNNVIDGFQQGFWLKGFSGKHLQNVRLKNNIIQNVTDNAFWVSEGAAYITGIVSANNLTYNVPKVWSRKPVGLVESGLKAGVNPGLTSTGARPSPYYFPVAGSVCIDAGVNVGLPYSGNAPDIGAYEHGNGATIIRQKGSVPAYVQK